MKKIVFTITLLLTIGMLSGCIPINKARSPSQVWSVNYFTDEFNDPTDEWYITNTDYIEGTFNNSATSNSKLCVKFYIHEDLFAIQLLEYGSHVVKNSSSLDQMYAITVKLPDGTKEEYYEFMPGDDDKIIFSSPYDYFLRKALMENSELSFYIEESGNKTTNYLFTVQADNFNELYNSKTGE